MVKISKTKHITKKGVVKKNPSKRKPMASYAAKRPKLIEMLGEETVVALEQQVDKIENSVPTTKNHYGDYMAVLGSMQPHTRKNVAILLILMGANEQGVKDAMRLL